MEDVIGLAFALVIGVPVILAGLTIAITAIALQVGLAIAVAGYIVGIPWSIYFRIRHGRWPA